MNIRIYKTRAFTRFMKKSGVNDLALAEAVGELSRGLHDGDLGRSLFKKRIGVPGKGKRGSVRTIVKKNERSNITEQELEALKALASDLFALDDNALRIAVDDGALVEIEDGQP